jgi:proteasome accessory factor C
MPKFADRVAQLPSLLEALWHHPDGLAIDDLAEEVGAEPEEVRETLLAYHLTDFAAYVPDLVYRPEVIEFYGRPDPDDDDDADRGRGSPMVRLVSNEPGKELGIAYASVPELARLYRAGADRLQLEPDNAALALAVQKLTDGLLPKFVPSAPSSAMSRPPEFHRAEMERRKVKIVYSRAWYPGVAERVIEPYAMVRTRRGWEVDAGPVDDHGRLRTYLLNGVQSFEVLAETFERPADVDALLRAQRRTTAVELSVPYDSRWAVDKYAEVVEVVAEDETSARLRAHLLEPVRQRVGLILLAAGMDARVVGPAELADAGVELARRLLDHYAAPRDESAQGSES